MTGDIRFETPENVRVVYHAAGLGTRFTAWMIDQIIVILCCIVMFFLLMLVSRASETVLDELVESLDGLESGDGLTPYFLGFFLLIFGLGSFFYFGLFELFMHGQTLGKRQLGIRVVCSNGFSLAASSILVRNLFRIADNIPALWIVPLVSEKSQRLGDMVAGTVVVIDTMENMSHLREQMLERNPAEMRYRFSDSALKRIREDDFLAVEKFLERHHDLDAAQKESLLSRLVMPLAKRLCAEPPPESERLRFLEDLLACEYQRRCRSLG
ncbi:MAG: RDD family protein [Pirellulales bacterium]|nr:RDD family protein [Pirellulales bacterium]